MTVNAGAGPVHRMSKARAASGHGAATVFVGAEADPGVRASGLLLITLGAELAKTACLVVRQRVGRVEGTGVQPDAARA